MEHGTASNIEHEAARELLSLVESRKATVGIMGLGYVGLPLALTFSESGMPVIGFDVDDAKVEALQAGRNYIAHIGDKRVADARAQGQLEATTDFSRLAEADVVVMAVPTPLTPQREPNMSYVVATTETLAQHLRRGQLVILESTTYPGTTDDLLRGILERDDLKSGEDFFLAYSPEREDPGNESFGTATIPKVVGGVGKDATALAAALYDKAISKTVQVSSARAAEACKLTENIFRAVNIALVNELKVIYDRMGIDVWEVLDAAESKPFGFMRFNPGPGLGGHCIPLDPFYLTWKAREYKTATRFIELAGEVNVGMPAYVIGKLQNALNLRGQALKDAKVLIMGLSYKKDIDDPRESPSFELMDLLLEHQAAVEYHDPHIPEMPSMRTWPHLPKLRSVELSHEKVASYDAVVISTAHSAIDYAKLQERAELVIDTRGVYREPLSNVVKA